MGAIQGGNERQLVPVERIGTALSGMAAVTVFKLRISTPTAFNTLAQACAACLGPLNGFSYPEGVSYNASRIRL
jgi:hypothetical protein